MLRLSRRRRFFRVVRVRTPGSFTRGCAPSGTVWRCGSQGPIDGLGFGDASLERRPRPTTLHPTTLDALAQAGRYILSVSLHREALDFEEFID